MVRIFFPPRHGAGSLLSSPGRGFRSPFTMDAAMLRTASLVALSATAVALLALPLTSGSPGEGAWFSSSMVTLSAQETGEAHSRDLSLHLRPAALEAEMVGPDPILLTPDSRIRRVVGERMDRDLGAMAHFRPGYAFWRHIFTIPDGSVVFGSGRDGRILAVFPVQGDWHRTGRWEEPALARSLDGHRLEGRLGARRDQVAEILQAQLGEPVIHNATRGRFLLPNARRYGSFIAEWGEIYQRFGVPAEVGLAQAILESGLNGTIRSEARAMGFCQWLPGNWDRMKRLSPHEIEGHNQTTQAAYCAAYLTVLATKFGSFIPALSEHHAGGTNVGRTIIKGERLGGDDIRERYLVGADFARDVRAISNQRFRPLVRSYGPRSFLYSEMVFGNTFNVVDLRESIHQERIHAMRAVRSISIEEVAQRTGLSLDEIRRYNPALIRRVPTGAALYLPVHVAEFGPDVAFWHRPADEGFAAVLADFLQLEADPEVWEDPSFGPVLREFRERFRATRSEEGTVMATVLGYVAGEMHTGRRAEILREFRSDPAIERLVQEGIRARNGRQGIGGLTGATR